MGQEEGACRGHVGGMYGQEPALFNGRRHSLQSGRRVGGEGERPGRGVGEGKKEVARVRGSGPDDALVWRGWRGSGQRTMWRKRITVLLELSAVVLLSLVSPASAIRRRRRLVASNQSCPGLSS